MKFFPNPESADESGLVTVGGDLMPERLLEAYRNGIFPWYDDEWPIMWWSPEPRAILELGDLYVSKRLRRTLRSGKFQLTINQAFPEVMTGCADRDEGSWITREMFLAYLRLHNMGFAHSVEVWSGDKLAGGIYGVAIGGFFAGESMFHQVSNASKVALFGLVDHLRRKGFDLFDIQMTTDHMVRMGATEISRRVYLRRLRKAIRKKVSF